jgi:hypothetical protein
VGNTVSWKTEEKDSLMGFVIDGGTVDLKGIFYEGVS